MEILRSRKISQLIVLFFAGLTSAYAANIQFTTSAELSPGDAQSYFTLTLPVPSSFDVPVPSTVPNMFGTLTAFYGSTVTFGSDDTLKLGVTVGSTTEFLTGTFGGSRSAGVWSVDPTLTFDRTSVEISGVIFTLGITGLSGNVLALDPVVAGKIYTLGGSTDVPEPGSIALMSFGLGAILLAGRRRLAAKN